MRGRSVGRGYYATRRRRANVRRNPRGDTEATRTCARDWASLTGRRLVRHRRLKDLIVIAGVNHHPQDIEWTVQHAHPSLQIDSGAAFAAETRDGAERLFIIQELRREDEKLAAANPSPIFAAIRGEVVNAHGLRPATIALLSGGAHAAQRPAAKVRRGAAARRS